MYTTFSANYVGLYNYSVGLSLESCLVSFKGEASTVRYLLVTGHLIFVIWLFGRLAFFSVFIFLLIFIYHYYCVCVVCWYIHIMYVGWHICSCVCWVCVFVDVFGLVFIIVSVCIHVYAYMLVYACTIFS